MLLTLTSGTAILFCGSHEPPSLPSPPARLFTSHTSRDLVQYLPIKGLIEYMMAASGAYGVEGWFPDSRDSWRLDAITLLAVIGESEIEAHSQAVS